MIPHPLSPGPLVWPTLPQSLLPTITLPVVNPSGSPEPSATATDSPSPTATPSEPSPTPSESAASMETPSSSPTPTAEPSFTTCGTTETPCSTVLVEDQFWPLLLGLALLLLVLSAVLAAQLRRP